MASADVVFTYGSTSGVESAFIGKPVVVMGPSAYDLLGCARRITSADEIAACLDEPPTPHPEKAIPYGLMMQRRGFNYARLSRTDDGRPELAGRGLRRGQPERAEGQRRRASLVDPVAHAGVIALLQRCRICGISR